jgi:hypothetical protein
MRRCIVHQRKSFSMTWASGLLVAAMLMAACGSSGSSATPRAGSTTTTSSTAKKPSQPDWVLEGKYTATIDPANFVAIVDNPYFPLPVGTTFHFEGTADGTPQTDDVVVTDRAKTVLGVRCTVVEDTVSENGEAIERTYDWYAQDKQGSVWYMGEDSFEKDDHGRFVKANDSWEAGVDGAQAGIIMPANPKPGDVYRQEFYEPGGALDQARVLRVDGHADVRYGSFDDVLVTEEWSPVEPQLEQKSYAAGVGELEEHITAGGNEKFQLVRVTHS